MCEIIDQIGQSPEVATVILLKIAMMPKKYVQITTT